jgi:hypothetical protein
MTDYVTDRRDQLTGYSRLRAPRAIRRPLSLEAAMLMLERAAVMCLPPAFVSAGFYLLAHSLLGLRADVAVFVCGGLFFLGVLTMAANMGSSAYSQRHDH